MSIEDRIIELEADQICTGVNVAEIMRMVSNLVSIVKRQQEQIAVLKEYITGMRNTIDNMLPDLDLIETFAEDEGERAEYIRRYMNLNDNWEEEPEPTEQA